MMIDSINFIVLIFYNDMTMLIDMSMENEIQAAL